MNKSDIPFINLNLTLLSGQTFLWNKVGENFAGSFNDKIVLLRQDGEDLFWQTYPEKDNFEFVKNYLNLDHDHYASLKKMQIDEHTRGAVKKYSGLTVLNQNFSETLFSFILASNKNIKAIRRSLEILKKQNNKFIEIDGEKYFFFPDYEFFKSVTIENLAKSGVGYRAKYLKDAAQKFEELYTRLKVASPTGEGLDEDQVRSELINIFGVGDKIADCVMTFSLGFKNLTPIDIWSERIIKDLYGNSEITNYKGRREWFKDKFKEYTALAGQYLFEYVRNFNPENYSN